MQDKIAENQDNGLFHSIILLLHLLLHSDLTGDDRFLA
jgi:hypothetical protein